MTVDLTKRRPHLLALAGLRGLVSSAMRQAAAEAAQQANESRLGAVYVTPLDDTGRPVGRPTRLGGGSISLSFEADPTSNDRRMLPLSTGGSITVEFEPLVAPWRLVGELFGMWPTAWVKAARRGRRLPPNAARWQRIDAGVQRGLNREAHARRVRSDDERKVPR